MNALTQFNDATSDQILRLYEQESFLAELLSTSDYLADMRDMFSQPFKRDGHSLDFKGVYTPSLTLDAQDCSQSLRLTQTFVVNAKGREPEVATIVLHATGQMVLNQKWEYSDLKIDRRKNAPLVEAEQFMERWVGRLNTQYRWAGVRFGPRKLRA